MMGYNAEQAAVDWSPRNTALIDLETRLGVFATTVSVLVICLCDVSGYLLERPTLARPVLAGSLCAICVLMQVALLIMVWRSLASRGEAFGPAVAACQPRCPLILRPVMALAWSSQFLIGCLYTFLAEGAIGDAGTGIAPQFWFMRFFVGLLCAYTTYLYLLLAIGAFTDNKLIVPWMWRKRFIVDVILAGVLISGKIWH